MEEEERIKIGSIVECEYGEAKVIAIHYVNNENFFLIHPLKTLPSRNVGFTLSIDRIRDYQNFLAIYLDKNIDDYAGKEVIWTEIEKISLTFKKREKDGNFCKLCNEYYDYAEAGFTCWSCKSDPYRMSPLNAVDDDWI